MPEIYRLSFDGAILVRDFWLYVWEVTVNGGRTVHYVGKTGDKAAGVSQSPFDRLSKHLGYNHNNNALRRHLANQGIDPAKCRFRFHSYGPIFGGEPTLPHSEACDIMSGLEKALADAMSQADYVLLNTVNCRMRLDNERFVKVRAAFAVPFPKLANGMETP